MRARLKTPANGSGREAEVLTFGALLVLLGRRSRQSIYDLMRRDPSFPRPRQLGSEFSIGWLRGMTRGLSGTAPNDAEWEALHGVAGELIMD